MKSNLNKSTEEEILVCSNCKHDFTWDGGNDNRGNIYICEDCGEPICVSCMQENEKYRKIIAESDGISGLERIQCINCFNKNVRS